LNRIGAVALRTTFRIRPRRAQCPPHNLQRRPLHYSPRLRADNDNGDAPPATSKSATANKAAEAELVPETPVAARSISGLGDDEHHFEPLTDVHSLELSPEAEAEAVAFFQNPPDDMKDLVAKLKREFEGIERSVLPENEILSEGEVQEGGRLDSFSKQGLMSMGDEAEEEPFEDEPYEGNDITSLAHGELEQHREIREYARIAAWEMPLLAKFAKPFELPTEARPLRFRYTTYMGEQHPAENKVVVEFCTADLPLKPAERLKLIKLLGARYNPLKDLVKMSCESFDTQAQNKRYLGDLVEKLVATARGKGNDEAAKDSFEDIPVDFRHVKIKKQPQFPEEWKMTPERRKLLQERRLAIAAGEQQRIEDGMLVDGMEVIAESHKVSSTARLLSNAQSMNQKLQHAAAGQKSRRPEMRIR